MYLEFLRVKQQNQIFSVSQVYLQLSCLGSLLPQIKIQKIILLCRFSWQQNLQNREGRVIKFIESDTEEELEFNIHNIIDQKEAIDIIIHYEEIIKKGNKKIR